MTVISNPLLLKKKAVADSAYQIENSLKYDDGEDTRAKRKQAHGNTRVFTISTWIKKSVVATGGGVHQAIIGAGSGSTTEGLFWKDSQALYAYIGGSSCVTSSVAFKDPSAWYHVVMAVDLTAAKDPDRCRIYVNGKLYSLDAYPNQHTESYINHKSHHIAWGARDIGSSWKGNGYFADSFLLDGISTSAAAFGEFDASNNWVAKEFALPSINNGSTWSSMMTSETGSWYSSSNVNLFNGILGAGSAGQTASASAEDKWIKFTPTGGLAFKQGIRVQHWPGGNSPYLQAKYTLKLTDGRVFDLHVSSSNNSSNFFTLYEGHGTIEYIQQVCSNNQFNNWGALEVDGVILKDGVRDSAERNNPNTGTVWSKNGTLSGNSTQSGKTFDRLFDGRLDQYAEQSGDNVTLSWTPSPAITVKKRMRIYFLVGGDPDDTVINGDATAINVDPHNGWTDVTVPSGGMSFSKLEMKRGGSGVYARASAIEIDGHILLDNTFDNSSHLKYNDTTTTSAIVQNSLTDDSILSGAILKGLDYYDDPDKANLKFAMTGKDLKDHSATIKGSGSNLTVSASGATTATDQSSLYGTSLYFDGSNDEITCSNSSAFDYGTGAFTIECWFMMKTFSGNMRLMSSGTGTANQKSHYQLCVKSDGAVRFDYDTTVGHTITSTSGIVSSTYQWYHIAVVRDTTPKATLYLNGKVVASSTNANTGYNANNAEGITLGRESSGSEWFNGWMNDFRMYNKVKYTGEFTPPHMSSFEPQNISAGGSQTFSATSTGTFEGGRGPEKAFNGSVNGTDYAHAGSGQTCSISWTAVTGITKLRLNIGKNNTGDDWGTLELNDTDEISSWLDTNHGDIAGTAQWVDVTSQLTGTSLSKIEISTSGNDDVRLAGIEVNGVILTDPVEGDVFVDSPTNYGTDTGAGGEVRGNYCTLNPVDSSMSSLEKGNLDYTNTSGWKEAVGTMGVSSGKWYYEVECIGGNGDGNSSVGWAYKTTTGQTGAGSVDYAVMFENAGWDQNFSTSKTDRSITVNEGDILGVSLDLDAGTPIMRTWVNDGSQNTINLGGNWSAGMILFPYVNSNDTGARWRNFNFGQRAFKKTCPTGYKALCSANLSDTFSGDNVNNPSKFFDIGLHTGNDTSTTYSPYLFKPDLVWFKNRDNTGYGHELYDAIRGVQKGIYSNLTNAEGTETNGLTAFTDNGFTVGDGNWVNDDGKDYVAWAWDAGTAEASDENSGSASSYKRWTNSDAGFSIVKATHGSGYQSKSLDHGLSATPDLIINKGLNPSANNEDWRVYHPTIGTGGVIYLNKTDAANSTNDSWKYSAVSSSSVTFDSYGTATDYIHYIWTAIKGYSHFGSYLGGKSDRFINCGFRPRIILVKCYDVAGESWFFYDSKRGSTPYLCPDTNLKEYTNGNTIHFNANGFTLQSTGNGSNGSSKNYIFAAWAEHPFKTANAGGVDIYA